MLNTRYIQSLFLVFFYLFFTNISHADCVNDPSSESFDCIEYQRTYDGDTFFINLPGLHAFFGESLSVRVRGIDTGEVKKYSGRTVCEVEMAHRAKNELSKVLRNAKTIELDNIEKGKYFRVLADVYVDGESLSEQMIYKKLAVEYYGGGRSGTDWCELKQEADELKESLGL